MKPSSSSFHFTFSRHRFSLHQVSLVLLLHLVVCRGTVLRYRNFDFNPPSLSQNKNKYYTPKLKWLHPNPILGCATHAPDIVSDFEQTNGLGCQSFGLTYYVHSYMDMGVVMGVVWGVVMGDTYAIYRFRF